MLVIPERLIGQLLRDGDADVVACGSVAAVAAEGSAAVAWFGSIDWSCVDALNRLGFVGRPHFEPAIVPTTDDVGVGVAAGFGLGDMGAFERQFADVIIPFRKRPDDGCVDLWSLQLVYVVVLTLARYWMIVLFLSLRQM